MCSFVFFVFPFCQPFLCTSYNYSNDWFWSRWWHKKECGDPKKPAEVVRCAQEWLAEWENEEDKGAHLYNPLTFNCEHFARMCKLGDDAKSFASLQVDRACNYFFGVGGTVALYLSAWIPLAFVVGFCLCGVGFLKYKNYVNFKLIKRLLCGNFMGKILYLR
jgi:hypothetical protein